jgi:transcriptional regulator with XRE-family HTH domain
MNNLKRSRQIIGMSQREIAKTVGQDPAAISRLEGGFVQNTAAGVKLKQAVAQVLKLPAELIFPELQGDKK